jgi:transcriptional regulator with XRE-family HTH domain
MNSKIPNYLRAYRKRWGLTQEELAFLLGLASQGAVSQYEGFPKRPGLEMEIAAKTIFNVSGDAIFPQVYENVEKDLLARALKLRAQLDPNCAGAKVKLQLLDDLIKRIEQR